MGGVIGAIVTAVKNSPHHQERVERRHERQEERHEKRADRRAERGMQGEIGFDVMTGRLSPSEARQAEMGMRGIQCQQAMGRDPYSTGGQLGQLQGDISGYQNGCPPPVPPGVQFSPWNQG